MEILARTLLHMPSLNLFIPSLYNIYYLSSYLSSSQRILESVKTDDSIACLHLLAHATPTDVNHQHSIHNGGSALHVACNLGRIVIVQLLVWVSNLYKALMNLLSLDSLHNVHVTKRDTFLQNNFDEMFTHSIAHHSQ